MKKLKYEKAQRSSRQVEFHKRNEGNAHMKTHWFLLLSGLVMSSACGGLDFLEYRLDERNNIPNLAGNVEMSIKPDFACGEPIATEAHTITTKKVTGGCEFTFEDEYDVLTAQDYKDIPNLKGATNLLKKFELEVRKLALIDVDSQKGLDLQTQVTSVIVYYNGQQLLDKSSLEELPNIIKLRGQALQDIKKLVDQRQPVTAVIRFVVVLPDTKPLPKELKIEYNIQPAIIVGP